MKKSMQYDLLPSNRTRPKGLPAPRGMIHLWSVVKRDRHTSRIEVFTTWCNESNAYQEADKMYLNRNDRGIYVAHRFGFVLNNRVHVCNMSPTKVEDEKLLNLEDPYADKGILKLVPKTLSDNLSEPLQYIAYCGSLELGTVTSEKGKFSFRPRARFAFIKAFTCAGLESVQERLNHSIKMMKSLLST